MRCVFALLFIACLMVAMSCKKYLDINVNPNQATSATPQALLPQAITGAASVLNAFNSYGAQLVGYSANAGGYGSFGSSVTYDFGSGDFAALWSNTYDHLEDFQAILDDSLVGQPAYIYFNAVARIMKVHGFELLVDTYNDIPYHEALKGLGNLTPVYDDAAGIYADLARELDTAMALIHAADTIRSADVLAPGATDVLFGSDMQQWLRFANTLKLRLIVRAGEKVHFSDTGFDPVGFIQDDAMVNPGYTRDNGKENPSWNDWAWTYAGATGNKAWMPNNFVFGFYDGHELYDWGRGSAIYAAFPGTGCNRLGHMGSDVSASPDGSSWYSGADRSGLSAGHSVGVLKGPDAGVPLFTLAECEFLQAEAVLRGIISGDAQSLFDAGIAASFRYLYELPDGTVTGDPSGDAAIYQLDNADSYLANFPLAQGFDQQLEAIITQKYLALNFINSNEAWNEYRRTGYPVVSADANADGYATFASVASLSTRPDRLPTRILYPSSESAYNSANMPKGISPFKSLIFWAK